MFNGGCLAFRPPLILGFHIVSDSSAIFSGGWCCGLVFLLVAHVETLPVVEGMCRTFALRSTHLRFHTSNVELLLVPGVKLLAQGRPPALPHRPAPDGRVGEGEVIHGGVRHGEDQYRVPSLV